MADQFSLFPENCSDWSIEMNWAEVITPRTNLFVRQVNLCGGKEGVGLIGLVSSPRMAMLKEHRSSGRDSFQSV
jgi:hypothetical protein